MILNIGGGSSNWIVRYLGNWLIACTSYWFISSDRLISCDWLVGSFLEWLVFSFLRSLISSCIHSSRNSSWWNVGSNWWSICSSYWGNICSSYRLVYIGSSYWFRNIAVSNWFLSVSSNWLRSIAISYWFSNKTCSNRFGNITVSYWLRNITCSDRWSNVCSYWLRNITCSSFSGSNWLFDCFSSDSLFNRSFVNDSSDFWGFADICGSNWNVTSSLWRTVGDIWVSHWVCSCVVSTWWTAVNNCWVTVDNSRWTWGITDSTGVHLIFYIFFIIQFRLKVKYLKKWLDLQNLYFVIIE
jgi:hypothetical protein